jgi:hypothetical protein
MPVDSGATVQIANFQTYVHLTNGSWVLVQNQSADPIIGAHYLANFSGNSSVPWNETTLSGGSASVDAPQSGYNDHFYPNARGTYAPATVDGVFVEASMKTNDPNANLIANLGADWWRSPTASFVSGFSNNPGAGMSDWVKLTTNYQTLYFSSLSPQVLQADPPPGLTTTTTGSTGTSSGSTSSSGTTSGSTTGSGTSSGSTSPTNPTTPVSTTPGSSGGATAPTTPTTPVSTTPGSSGGATAPTTPTTPVSTTPGSSGGATAPTTPTTPVSTTPGSSGGATAPTTPTTPVSTTPGSSGGATAPTTPVSTTPGSSGGATAPTTPTTPVSTNPGSSGGATAPTTPTTPVSTTPGSSGGATAPTTPVAPKLTVADHTLSVSPGGKVSLGIGVSVPHAGDNVSVNISGLAKYETITDNLDHKTFSGSSVTLTAAEVNSGLSLSSFYRGHGHPTGTLTVTAHDATGTPVTSAAQTITVKDPPSATASAGTSTTTSGGGTSSGQSHHWWSDHHHQAVAATSSGTSTTTSGQSSGQSQASHSNVAQWFDQHPGFAQTANTLSEAGASQSSTSTTSVGTGAGARSFALLNQMMAGDFNGGSHFAQATTASSASSQQQANLLTRPLH